MVWVKQQLFYCVSSYHACHCAHHCSYLSPFLLSSFNIWSFSLCCIVQSIRCHWLISLLDTAAFGQTYRSLFKLSRFGKEYCDGVSICRIIYFFVVLSFHVCKQIIMYIIGKKLGWVYLLLYWDLLITLYHYWLAGPTALFLLSKICLQTLVSYGKWLRNCFLHGLSLLSVTSLCILAAGTSLQRSLNFSEISFWLFSMWTSFSWYCH